MLLGLVQGQEYEAMFQVPEYSEWLFLLKVSCPRSSAIEG